MIDVFRIGVEIGMKSNGSEVLGVLLRDLGRVEGAVSALKKNMDGLKGAAVGALSVLAGGAALKGIWSMVDASKELNKQLENIKLQGGSADPERNYSGRINEIRAKAFAISAAVPQIAPSESARILNEASNQFGIDTAEQIGVTLAKLEAQLQRNGKGGDLQAGLKAIDQIGGFIKTDRDGNETFDAGLLSDLLDKMRRGIAASGGMIGPKDYLAFAKQAGLSAKQMDSDVVFGTMTEAMIAMGASRAGTASGSLYQQIIGGTMTEKVAAELKKYGLLQSYRVGRGGHIMPNTASVLRKDLFEKNEFSWINDVVVPKLQERGMNDRQVLEEISHLFGRQTTQRLAGEFINNRAQFNRTGALFSQAYGIDAAQNELNANDLENNLRGLQGAWTGLMQAVGEAGVPAAIGIIHRLTDAIVALEQAAASDPEATRGLLETAAGFSALLVVGGSLKVISVALGPLANALSALAGASKAFAAGSAARTALAFLSGPLGLLALAGAIETLGRAFPAIPGWLITVSRNAAVGAAVGSVVPGVGTTVGAVAGAAVGIVGALPPSVPSAVGIDAQRNSVYRPTFGPNSRGVVPGSSQEPIHVIIDNHDQVARSVSVGTMRGLTNTLSGPPVGPSSPDIRVNPYVQAPGP